MAFFNFGKKGGKGSLPEIVQAGDPVLHEPAVAVDPSEIETPELERIIDEMVEVMRQAPGVGLAAPQIGINKQVSSCFCKTSESERLWKSAAPADLSFISGMEWAV